MSDSKLGRWIAALALWSVVLSCSNLSYDSEYDPGVDFNGYESYAWLEAGLEAQRGGPAVGEMTEQRIMEAIDERLQAKGYRIVRSAMGRWTSE